MKKVLTLLAGVSFLLSFALCANALADDLPSRAGTFTISPLIGGYLFDGEQHLKHSGVYNLNLGYNFTENLGIEVGAGFINTGFRANAGGGRVAGSLYHMDMLYHVTNLMPNLEPYAEVGGGAVLLDPEHADLRANAMVNFGGGIEYFLMPEIALRADVRDLVTFNNHYGDNTENNLMYTAGITVYFGGKKQEAVAEAAPPPPVEEVKPTPAPPPP
ncbi:MAG: outer membrane beta-barrel protein, partial [Nitrospirota bacterium]